MFEKMRKRRGREARIKIGRQEEELGDRKFQHCEIPFETKGKEG